MFSSAIGVYFRCKISNRNLSFVSLENRIEFSTRLYRPRSLLSTWTEQTVDSFYAVFSIHLQSKENCFFKIKKRDDLDGNSMLHKPLYHGLMKREKIWWSCSGFQLSYWSWYSCLRVAIKLTKRHLCRTSKSQELKLKRRQRSSELRQQRPKQKPPKLK